ncbi:methionyl-tRNA formyltransferase [Thermosporothrix hazakensis]|nr:methionyl-tRNA formyltransferase [Thermosporothrix hazakensis]
MEGSFSAPVLSALLKSGIEVCAVILPAQALPGRTLQGYRRREPPAGKRVLLPIVRSSLHTSIVQIAWKHSIPVWDVFSLSAPETRKMLAAYRPDLICVACFSTRIPRSVLRIPRLGSLNVHPSLLPANRGPVPLFWTFRFGCERTGVSVHLLEEKMDSGAILAQGALSVPEGIDYEQLEIRCAELGGVLLVRAVQALVRGEAQVQEQDEAQSSYYSFPAEQDFVVPAAQWEARHVYRFVCGVGAWGELPVQLISGQEVFLLRECISYSHEGEADGVLVDEVAHEAVVPCLRGTVTVRYLERRDLVVYGKGSYQGG